MTERDADERRTMAEVSHTHPETNETFGAVYRRGPAMADGGATDARTAEGEETEETPDEPAATDAESSGSEATDATDAADDDRDPMREVDHTPREGEGANEVWERGDVDE
jgi:hypothetical protein